MVSRLPHLTLNSRLCPCFSFIFRLRILPVELQRLSFAGASVERGFTKFFLPFSNERGLTFDNRFLFGEPCFFSFAQHDRVVFGCISRSSGLVFLLLRFSTARLLADLTLSTLALWRSDLGPPGPSILTVLYRHSRQPGLSRLAAKFFSSGTGSPELGPWQLGAVGYRPYEEWDTESFGGARQTEDVQYTSPWEWMGCSCLGLCHHEGWRFGGCGGRRLSCAI
jgi:hypothetical protein